MKLVPAKCPSCGADIEVDKDSDSTKCEYCDSKILVEDAIAKIKVELSGSVEVKNMPKLGNYVSLADRYYSEFRFREANTEYKKALELDPHNIKLIFRQHICRCCMASVSNYDPFIIYNAFDEVNKNANHFDNIDDVKNLSKKDDELSEFAYESCNANAYMINKIVDYYKSNNLQRSELIILHSKIQSSAMTIDYARRFILKNEKEKQLDALDYYISAMHILAQPLSYRKKRTKYLSYYNASIKSKRLFIKNKKEAESEREQLLNENPELINKTSLNIKNGGYYSVEIYNYLIVGLIILSIIGSLICIGIKYYFGIIVFAISFILQLRQVQKSTNTKKDMFSAGLTSVLIIIFATIIAINAYSYFIPKYLGKWQNESMTIEIKDDKAVIVINATGEKITDKYEVINETTGEETKYRIKVKNYEFIYTEKDKKEKMCQIVKKNCTNELKKS